MSQTIRLTQCFAGSLLLLLMMCATAHAAKVDVRVSSESVEIGDSVEYTILASNDGDDEIRVIKDPEYKGFALVGRAKMPRITFTNGKVSRQVQLMYKLRPRKVGVFKIIPPVIKIGDKEFKLVPQTIKVVQQGKGPKVKVTKKQGVSVIAKVKPERAPYVGEQLLLEYDLYVDTRKMGARPSHPSEPSLDAFWIEEIEPDRMGSKQMVRQGATFFEKIQLRKYALFPLRAGEAVIEPMSVDLSLGGLLGARKRVKIQSDPIKLDVKPLPAGAPDGFSESNIGTWSFVVTTDSIRSSVGRPVTVRVTVSGEGQPGRLKLPEFKELEGFKISHIEQKVDSKIQNRKVVGSQSMIYTLTPLKEGSFNLPALKFVYFDPNTASYEAKSSSPIRLDISPGKLNLPENPPVEPVSRKESSEKEVFATLRGDLRPVKRQRSSARASSPQEVAQTPWFLGLVGFGFILLLTLLFSESVRSIIQKDTPARRKSIALKEAQTALSRANTHEEIVVALRAFLTTGLGLSTGHVTAREVASRLIGIGVSSEDASEVAQILKSCERARFSKETSLPAAIEDLRVRALSWVERQRRVKLAMGAAAVLFLGVASVLMMGAPSPSYAQDASYEEGLTAFDARNWEEASAKWDELLKESPYDTSLLYNQGLTSLRLERFGKARLMFERALFLNPKDRDTAKNLELTTRMIRVRMIERTRGRSGLLGADDGLFWWDMARRVTANTLGFILLLSIWSLCVMIWVRRRTDQPALRDTLFIVSILAAVLALGSAVGWGVRAQVMATTNPGVIVTDDAMLRDGPSEFAAQRRVSQPLIQGVRVPIEEQRKGWLKVRFSDGTSGWLPGESIEPVVPKSP